MNTAQPIDARDFYDMLLEHTADMDAPSTEIAYTMTREELTWHYKLLEMRITHMEAYLERHTVNCFTTGGSFIRFGGSG